MGDINYIKELTKSEDIIILESNEEEKNYE